VAVSLQSWGENEDGMEFLHVIISIKHFSELRIGAICQTVFNVCVEDQGNMKSITWSSPKNWRGNLAAVDRRQNATRNPINSGSAI